MNLEGKQTFSLGFPGNSHGKESSCNAGDLVFSLGWEIPRRREWPPTSVFLHGEFHGQSLAASVHGVAKSQK